MVSKRFAACLMALFLSTFQPGMAASHDKAALASGCLNSRECSHFRLTRKSKEETLKTLPMSMLERMSDGDGATSQEPLTMVKPPVETQI